MQKRSMLLVVTLGAGISIHCGTNEDELPARERRATPPDASPPRPLTGAIGNDAGAQALGAHPDASLDADPPPASPPRLLFPRLGSMSIGNPKQYDDPVYQAQLAKHDFVVLGMYFGWARNGKTPLQATNEIRARNPNIRLANYTIMTETTNTPGGSSGLLYTKLSGEKGPNGVGDWWAYDKDGKHTDWANGLYGNWDTNVTLLTTPDANGDHYPQWLAKADYDRLIKDGGFDVWYCDNNFWRPRVDADWNRDGVNDSKDDITVRNWFRDGQRAYYERAKSIAPNIKLMVNADSDLSGEVHPTNADDFAQYKGVVHTAFMERLVGKSWSTETWGGFVPALAWYRKLLTNVLEPGGVMVDAYLASPTDYKSVRYAFALTLLDDGYFSISTDYGAVSWFDEFDLAGTASTKWLGAAIDPPPAAPYQNGVWRRRFEHGMAIVNPKGNGAKTIAIEAGYKRFKGTQDPQVNDGTKATSITLADRDGILLVSE